MKILYNTGNKFRKLTWEEYKDFREDNGNFSNSEKKFFDQVITYCVSIDKARKFSKSWKDL